jgi:hypothetical protein
MAPDFNPSEGVLGAVAVELQDGIEFMRFNFWCSWPGNQVRGLDR